MEKSYESVDFELMQNPYHRDVLYHFLNLGLLLPERLSRCMLRQFMGRPWI